MVFVASDVQKLLRHGVSFYLQIGVDKLVGKVYSLANLQDLANPYSYFGKHSLLWEMQTLAKV